MSEPRKQGEDGLGVDGGGASASELERKTGSVVAVKPIGRLKRFYQRFKFAVRAAVVVAVLLAVAVGFLTQGPFPKWLAGRLVRDAVGAEFDAESVSLKLDGRLVIERPRLRVGGEGLGEAGEFARAGKVEVLLDFGKWTSGVVEPVSVTVSGAVVRVSQDRVTGQLNMGMLRPKPEAAGGRVVLPRIDVAGATIELGEHGGSAGAGVDVGFKKVVEVAVKGSLSPVGAVGEGRGRYAVRIEQESGAGLGRGGEMLRVEGVADLGAGAGEFIASSIDLSKWPAERMPGSVRASYAALNIAGDIPRASVRYGKVEGVSVELALKGVALDLPIGAGRAETGGTVNARVEDVTGTVRLGDAGVDAVIDGVVEDLAMNVKFRSRGALPGSAYSATLVARDFKLEKNPRLLLFTPAVVRKNLDLFGGPTAVLDAQIDLEGTGGAGDKRSVTGTIILRAGEAAFENFPYPIKDLQGKVRFDDEKVEIVSLRGRGETGATLLAEGRIAPITAQSGLDLRITLTDLPIDEVLRAAVDAGQGKGMLDLIFDRWQFGRLVEAGLVQTLESRQAAVKEMGELLLSVGGKEENLSAEQRVRMDGLRRSAERAVFSMGGVIDRAEIYVHNEPGPSTMYDRQIEVRFGTVGLVPSALGYPVVAEDLRLKIDDKWAELRAEKMRGLSGGRAAIRARVPLGQVEVDGVYTAGSTAVKVEAWEIPIDDLMLHAMPRTGQFSGLLSPDQQGPRLGTISEPEDLELVGLDAADVLRNLGVKGKVNLAGILGPEAGGEDRFTVKASFEGLSAEPKRGVIRDDSGAVKPGRVALREVSGAISVDNEGLQLERLTAKVLRLNGDERWAGLVGPPAPVDEEADRVVVDASLLFGRADDGVPGELEAQVKAERLDLTLAVEDVVAAISPTSAEQFAAARKTYDPSGRLSCAFDIFGVMYPAPRRVRVDMRGAGGEGLEVTALGGRLSVDHLEGTWRLSATFTPSDTDSVLRASADGLRANVWFDRELAGELGFDADLKLVIDPAGDERTLRPAVERLSLDRGLKLELRNVRVGSELLRRGIELSVPEWAGKLLREKRVEGLIDAEVAVAHRSDESLMRRAVERPGEVLSAFSKRFELSGAVRATELSLTSRAERVEITNVSGEVRFDPEGGKFNRLVLLSDRWEGTLDGSWVVGAGAVDVQARVGLEAPGLEKDMLALLPQEIGAALEGAKVSIDGGLALRDGRLAISAQTQGERKVAAGFDGELRFAGLSADVGVMLRRASGSLKINIEKPVTQESAVVRLGLNSPGLVAGPFTVTEATASVVANRPGREGTIELTSLNGRTSAGRLSVEAFVEPVASEGQGRRYQAAATLAGVRFAELLRDVKRNNEEADRFARGGALSAFDEAIIGGVGDVALTIDPTKAVGLPAPVEVGLGGRVTSGVEPGAGDLTRGSLDARLAIAGVLGGSSTGAAPVRSGSGAVRIVGGDVVKVPLVVPLIKLSALQLPTDERLDFFQTSFDLEGNDVRLSEIGLMSGSVAVLGSGTMKLPDFGLDLRLQTSAPGMPLVGGVLDALRNQIVTTTVKGTLNEPSIGTEVLAKPRRFFVGLFGGDRGEDGVDAKAEERLRRERRRVLESLTGGGIGDGSWVDSGLNEDESK
jgi:hypothetical protein